MEQGPTEQLIISQCVKTGRPLPRTIQDAPVLKPGLQLFLEAFYELSSTRTTGLAEGPIPWTAIHEYCVQYGIEGDQREATFYTLRHLDMVYLKHRDSKRDTK